MRARGRADQDAPRRREVRHRHGCQRRSSPPGAARGKSERLPAYTPRRRCSHPGRQPRALRFSPDFASACSRMRLERGDLVIALGGGVIGDLAGFAASIVRRGMRFVQVPTSLLAQVDSSVGGKTGINTAQGKNLVGTFHQPSLVLADTDALATLPPRQFRAGYVEAAKYGLLADAAVLRLAGAECRRPYSPGTTRRSRTPSPSPCRARPTSSPATRRRPATACCSTSDTRSAMRWRRGPASPTGSCTARPSRSASAWRSGSPSSWG